ncbi:hypothetical protein CC53_gp061 [Rhizobium phage vB_RleS_L338C]|uniref:hypothetical protein n=1 Tax=Rhizobium phage vB_RleS_L338C TaxID=1414737 RepID=UPI0003D91E25|nr:hypothetical protein CC53_gp061 [Rhizobium phage vB_RleS_L338C]AHC30478.1 hypothetical protein L338C_061 [Rhizobium phage vB_RleS_L338C]QNH72097.1 hypothetical protein P11VFA_084 [Rhizobium phage P11VFA]
MSKVVTHSRFQLSDINAETLKGMGVEVLADFPSDADLGLTTPAYGEEVLGTLSVEEFSIFVEMNHLSKEIERITKSIAARKMREVADRMEGDDDLMSAAVMGVESAGKNFFDNEEEEDHFHTLNAKFALLRSTLYWVLGERYHVHSWRCGIRANRRFVKVEKRLPNG